MRTRPADSRRPTRLSIETLEARLAMAAAPLVGLAGDWDGDGQDTPALYDPSSGTIYLRNTNTPGFPNAARQIPGATAVSIPLIGDWNADGVDTIGLYDPRTRTLRWTNRSLVQTSGAIQLENTSARFRAGAPVAGDWDGDGQDSLGIYNRTVGKFYLRNSLSSAAADAVFAGWAADSDTLPVAGDWDGDGSDNVGLLNTRTGRAIVPGVVAPGIAAFGARDSRGAQPLVGDWDGDGRDSLGLLKAQSLVFVQKDEIARGPIDRGVYLVPSLTLDTQSTGALSAALTADDRRITNADVAQLLRRAAAASASNDAIIAIVDRAGHILGVRVESGVTILDEETLVFAIDGAVAKARTGAFFSNSTAPLTSRTIRFISQSTITQREVESNPSVQDINSPLRGPGFVAPIGVGGHFPPGVANTPHVDLFRIEHTNRDSIVHPGPDSIKGTADDIPLMNRFNVPDAFVPPSKEVDPPESYGLESGRMPDAQSRGIATLPGGIGLYKNGLLVGGIGVFFPGSAGFATFEQGFVAGRGQTAEKRTNASRVLEAEWIAFAAAGGSTQAGASVGALNGVARAPGYNLPSGRIDLAGIKLEIYGPHPDGPKTLLKVGQRVGRGSPNSGANQPVAADADGDPLSNVGQEVPEGWLVLPHGGTGLSAADVERIIEQGIAEANKVRAQIRLKPNGDPGERTRMVLSVADTDGNVLGLFRMPDATVFSIDVAVAKARNTAYYADPADLINADQVDDDRNGNADLKRGIAFTNRTFRFLAEPRFPSGVDGTLPGPFSILRDLGINRKTAENSGAALPASVYSNLTSTVLAFDAFNPGRNFRDPDNIANQNGVVFFPGSTPLYHSQILVGGFGVSGDGVDQDDVVTFSGSVGYQAPSKLRADQFKIRGVRLPFQKFPRNPRA